MSELFFGDPDKVLLRAGTLQEWYDEKADLVKQRDEIAEKIQALDQKLQAAMLISGDVFWAAIADDIDAVAEKVAQESESMSQAAERIVVATDRPLAPREVLTELKKTPEFKERLDKNVNYFYTMMKRLTDRERIARVGTKYGPPSVKAESAKGNSHAL